MDTQGEAGPSSSTSEDKKKSKNFVDVKKIFSSEKPEASTSDDKEPQIVIPSRAIKTKSIFTASTLTQMEMIEDPNMLNIPDIMEEEDIVEHRCQMPRMSKYQWTLLISVVVFIFVMATIIYLSTNN